MGIIVKAFEGTTERKFGHALVAGLERPPLKATRAMDKKKIEKRSRCKPFVKFINLRHLMPTRYQVKESQIDVKSTVKASDWNPEAEKTSARKDAKKNLKELFAKTYLSKQNGSQNPGIKFFFTKLRF